MLACNGPEAAVLVGRGTGGVRDTASVAGGNADLIRGVYGFNWAAVGDRGEGLAAARAVMSDDVQAQISPEVGDRTLRGVDDFSEFRYQPEQFEELSPEELAVSGQIVARGRRINMPLSAPFRHVWTIRDGRATQVEAQMRS